MSQQKKSAKIQTIQIIHGAIMIGVFMFVFVIIFLSGNSETITNPDVQFLELQAYISIAFLLIAFFIGQLIFKKKIGEAKKIMGSEYKQELTDQILGIYQTANIIRIGILDGAALFAAITMFQYVQATGSLSLDDIAIQIPTMVICLFYICMFYWFPTNKKILATIKKSKGATTL